jgi:hypothetical protein
MSDCWEGPPIGQTLPSEPVFSFSYYDLVKFRHRQATPDADQNRVKGTVARD